MELHPECSLCTHAADIISNNGRQIGNVRPYTENKSYSVEELISGGGGLFPTNSMLFQAILVKKMPDFYMNCPIGDSPLQTFLALNGDVYYIDKCMSIYRSMAEGSWSRNMAKNVNAKILHLERMIKMYSELDKYTDHRYSNTINDTILKNEFLMLYLKSDIKNIMSSKYRKHYNKLSNWQKSKIYIKAYLPCFDTLLRKIRWNWNAK
jgi:hypothetical protein